MGYARVSSCTFTLDSLSHQVTSHLLPAAFIYIHKYIQNKSGGCSTRDQQRRDDDFLALPVKQVTSNLDSDLHENQNLSGPQGELTSQSFLSNLNQINIISEKLLET